MVLRVAAANIAFNPTTLDDAPAGEPFAIEFDNQDPGIPHNVEIRDPGGAPVFTGEIFNGAATRTYNVPALEAGDYTFVCTVHPNMTGTLKVSSNELAPHRRPVWRSPRPAAELREPAPEVARAGVMTAPALGAGTPRRRVLFGLLDADSWSWATIKALFWFVAIIMLLGYIPDRAYYFTVFSTIDLGINVVSPVNLCPPENRICPVPSPPGAALPWEPSPPELGAAGAARPMAPPSSRAPISCSSAAPTARPP